MKQKLQQQQTDRTVTEKKTLFPLCSPVKSYIVAFDPWSDNSIAMFGVLTTMDDGNRNGKVTLNSAF